MARVYRNATRPTVDIPDLDLLTFLFDSPLCLAEDDTVIHASAEHPGQSLTKRQLLRYTRKTAHCLRHHHGIGVNGLGNDVVTVVSSGQPLLPAAFFGVIAAGGVYSSAHATTTSRELVNQLETSGSKVLICSQGTIEVTSQAARQLGIPAQNILILESYPTWTLRMLDSKSNLLNEGSLTWIKITNRKELVKSLIVIVWSSGTTGVPKGVKLSHRNLVAQTYITHLPGRDHADQDPTYEPFETRSLAHLPASHIAGLFGYFISTFYAGGLVFWMERYEWKLFLRYMKEHRITVLFTVPSIWQRIARSSEVIDQFASLRIAQSGSAPFGSSLQKAASKQLQMSEDGLVAPTWGLTETTGGVTMAQINEKNEVGTLGSLLPGFEVRLLDEKLRDVEEGQPGELVVRGPTVTQGYFNNEAATKETFYNDWLKTGDIAKVKDGKFIMVDRKKDLLKYKGQQVAPVELETLLCTHPDIEDAAVIGIQADDDPSSDLPRAYIVAKPSIVQAKEVQEFMKSKTSNSKQLRGGIIFVDSIPRNVLGKILRRDLAERAKKEVGRERRAKL